MLTAFEHDRNIAHRDIRPEIIFLVDDSPTIKLGDFLLTAHIQTGSKLSDLCGAPSYVAPEVLSEDRFRQYDQKVDVWSLGVVLYICLCGFPPFSDELYTREFPYTLSPQIRRGQFGYPSPAWDPVSDSASTYQAVSPTLEQFTHTKRSRIDRCNASRGPRA